MGLVNFWALPRLSLLSPLRPFFSWQLFIASSVAPGAASKEVGGTSHSYSTFLRKASHSKENHFYLFHCGLGQSVWAGRKDRDPVGSAPACCPALGPCLSGPLHQPPATELWSHPAPSPELWCVASGVWAAL